MSAIVVACSVYANLAFLVTEPAAYRWFPPFRANLHAADQNRDLGAEYFNIARSITQGRGFADPFGQSTGPTAWMPPILSLIESALLSVADGNRNAVAAMVVALQIGVLIGTGLLVMELIRRTTRRIGATLTAVIFLAALLGDFRWWFQATHDCWLVLLSIDVLIAGWCWWRPLADWRTAAVWGLAGGLCAQINPVVGLVWFLMTALSGLRQRAWSRLACALAAATLALAPWTIRNYLMFQRWIPVKSNLAYELYQSQCLQTHGALTRATFRKHPHGGANLERDAYVALGECDYLDRKRERFWQSVRAAPTDFLCRIGDRFLAATLWYEPFDPAAEAPWIRYLNRIIHPLPFVALVFLLFSSRRTGLHRAQCVVIGIFMFYLWPYVVISYYDRYAVPLVGVKALLVCWALDRLLTLLVDDDRMRSPS